MLQHSKKSTYVIFFVFVFIGLTTSIQAKTEQYVIDPAHSSVTFRITHFFSKVTGYFKKFDGTIILDNDSIEKNAVSTEIDIASIDTNNEARDKHLQSGGFFNATQYPKLAFQSKSWKRITDSEYEITGDLTMHGITQPVVLKAKNLGSGDGKNGVYISGWEAHANIKRSNFGINSGIPAVGDEVEIEINIEAHRK